MRKNTTRRAPIHPSIFLSDTFLGAFASRSTLPSIVRRHNAPIADMMELMVDVHLWCLCGICDEAERSHRIAIGNFHHIHVIIVQSPLPMKLPYLQAPRTKSARLASSQSLLGREPVSVKPLQCLERSRAFCKFQRHERGALADPLCIELVSSEILPIRRVFFNRQFVELSMRGQPTLQPGHIYFQNSCSLRFLRYSSHGAE